MTIAAAAKRHFSKSKDFSLVFLLIFIGLFKCGQSKTIKCPNNEPYDFILGYSTGRVGTTTLSEGRLYGIKKHFYGNTNVVFLHELNYGMYWFRGDFNTSVYQKSSKEEQYAFVKNEYVPFLIKSRQNANTLLDLGHNNLYFIEALIEYLLSETSYCFIFVRIRRNRLENALSLSFERPLKTWEHELIEICDGLKTRYCPFDGRVPELGPMSHEMWKNFTLFQRAFWIMDETEAKWNKLIHTFPEMKYIEVEWGKIWPGSMEKAALAVASLINVAKIAEWDPEWAHMRDHEHAGNSTEVVDFAALDIEDRAYQRMMKFKYKPA